jgi:hypothetical protein
MTTIVYRDGVLAGDTQSSEGYYKSAKMRKVFKVSNHLVGFCGDAAAIPPLKKWVRNGFSPEEEMKKIAQHLSYSMLVIPQNGKVFYKYSDSINVFREEFPKTHFKSEGSGSDVAIGALIMGATAVEAVKAAIQVDLYSGGNVMHVEFD